MLDKTINPDNFINVSNWAAGIYIRAINNNDGVAQKVNLIVH